MQREEEKKEWKNYRDYLDSLDDPMNFGFFSDEAYSKQHFRTESLAENLYLKFLKHIRNLEWKNNSISYFNDLKNMLNNGESLNDKRFELYLKEKEHRIPTFDFECKYELEQFISFNKEQLVFWVMILNDFINKIINEWKIQNITLIGIGTDASTIVLSTAWNLDNSIKNVKNVILSGGFIPDMYLLKDVDKITKEVIQNKDNFVLKPTELRNKNFKVLLTGTCASKNVTPFKWEFITTLFLSYLLEDQVDEVINLGESLPYNWDVYFNYLTEKGVYEKKEFNEKINNLADYNIFYSYFFFIFSVFGFISFLYYFLSNFLDYILLKKIILCW